MRAYSYRILVATTTGDTISISVCKDTYRQGRQMASDLVSLRDVEPQMLGQALDVAAAQVFNLVSADMPAGPPSRPRGAAPSTADACTTTADGADQDPIPGC